jgi:hypothetical protein
MEPDCTGEGTRHSSAHGTVVTWGGTNLGRLTGVTVRAGRAALVDITSAGSTVIGTGWTSRVIREVGVGSIEPASVSLTLYAPGWTVTQNDRGDVRYLNVQGEWGSYYGDAILMDYSLNGRVGEFVTMSVDFTFTGS